MTRLTIDPYEIESIPPEIALGEFKKDVSEFYNARRVGASSQEYPCIVFGWPSGALACAYHTFCPALPAIKQYQRLASEREVVSHA